MKTFTVTFGKVDGYEDGHSDNGRVLEDGKVEVWCPWDRRWVTFSSLEAALSLPGYESENAVFAWDHQDV